MLTAIPDTTSSFSASDGCSEMSETRPKGALLPFFAMPFAMRLPECPATFARRTRVEPLRPQPPGTGENTFGSSSIMPACCSGFSNSTP
jgi:hypothetical protein